MESKRYHIVIASLLFGVLMWGSVTLGDDYYISLEIPLVTTNVPAGKALKGYIPSTVTLHLKGTGWRIVSTMFSGIPQCVLNISSFGSHPVVLTKSQILNSIALTGGLQPVDINLDTLVVSLDNYAERSVAVRSAVIIECPEGYGVVGDIRIEPDSVTVGGSASLLRTVDFWNTERQVFTNVREPLTVTVRLEDPSNRVFTLKSSTVRLSANVQPFAEKTLVGLPVETRSLPANREVIFIPPKIDLIVRGGIEQLASVSSEDFRLHVDYNDLLSDTSGFVQPTVESPSGVRVLARRPDRLQYVIRKRL